MSMPLKTFLNRCRCCLEPFESNEDPAQITDFFEIQYYAFTRVELKQNDLLSKYVCEYCHLELVRFSVWKKDLIEKQKQLYKLLNQHIQEEFEESDSDDGEILENDSVEISDEEEELAVSDKIIHQNGKNVELMDTDDDGSTEINEETTEVDDDTYITTEHESDDDFELSRSMMNREKQRVLTTLAAKKRDDLRCEICKATFLGRQGLVRHVQFCKKGNKVKRRKKAPEKMGKFRCFCNERFISHRALNIHRTRAHGKNSNMSWDMVNDSNDDNSLEVRSSRTAMNNNNNSMDNKLMPRNTSSTTTIRKKPIKCKYCSFNSVNGIKVLNHMRKNHEEALKKNHACVECDKTFSCTAALRVHINDIHLDIRPHTCLYCKANFKQLVHLKDHMLSIHKALHKPYCCTCSASFCTLKALKLHKLQEHKNEDGDLIKVLKEAKTLAPSKLSGRYICVCTREFAYPSRLSEHQRHCKLFKSQNGVETKDNLVPAKTEVFKCFKCRRVFNNRSNLIRHQKCSGHLDAAQLSSLKFQCKNCEQKFFSAESLGKHTKNNSCHILDSD